MPLFFNHIPKTAGTTLQTALVSCAPRDKVLSSLEYPGINADSASTFNLFRRGRYDIVMGHIGEFNRRRFFPDHLAIAILRHPVERFRSQFDHHNRDGEQFSDMRKFLAGVSAAIAKPELRQIAFRLSMSGFLCPLLAKRTDFTEWRGSMTTILDGLNSYDIVLTEKGVDPAIPLLRALFDRSPPLRPMRLNRAADFAANRQSIGFDIERNLREIFPEDFVAYEEAQKREAVFLERLSRDPLELLFDLKGGMREKLPEFTLDWTDPPPCDGWGSVVFPAIAEYEKIPSRIMVGRSSTLQLPLLRNRGLVFEALVWCSYPLAAEDDEMPAIRFDGIRASRAITRPIAGYGHLALVSATLPELKRRGWTQIEFTFPPGGKPPEFWLLAMSVNESPQLATSTIGAAPKP
jgi:hypothetical protein